MSYFITEAAPVDAPRLLAYIHARLPELNINLSEFHVQNVAQEEAEITAFREWPNSLFFFVEDTDKKVLGTATLTGYGFRGTIRESTKHIATLGMSIHPDYRGQMIGDELLETILEEANNREVIRRVEIDSYETNPRARKFFLRHGFEIEGIKKNAILRNGEYIDVCLLARLL